jgi:hypothetical protein
MSPEKVAFPELPSIVNVAFKPFVKIKSPVPELFI